MTAMNQLGIRSRFVTLDIPFLNTRPNGTDGFLPRDMWDKNCAEYAEQGPCYGEFHEIPGIDGISLIQRDEEEVAWVFCDGCHCRECVEGELSSWWPIIADNGFMLFHDYGAEYSTQRPDQFYHDREEPRQIEVYETLSGIDLQGEIFGTSPPKRRKDGKFFGGMLVLRKKTR